MRTMTAIDSRSKELERLLEVISARKDQAAFSELYSATKGKLFSTVLQIVRRSDLAEEIIQDVYVRIWHSASSYRSSRGTPMTWMITIARNLAIDDVRKSAQERFSDASRLMELPADGPSALETIEVSEDQRTALRRHHDIVGALQALHPTRRDLIIAAYIHGESREQLAQRTGVPINTIKTRIRRSLLELESMLRSKQETREQVFNGAPRTARNSQVELATAMG